MVSRENRFQNRLPPKVLSRKKTGKKRRKSSRRRKQPWYRHTPWIVSLAACGVFIVLIGGVFGVRQVIILVRGTNSEVADEVEEDGTPKNSADQKKSSDPELAASLESSEPGMEVLPPKAAKQPGRKLPKMLLVGRRPQMFQSLAEAMQYAIGGDIIEIRFSGPLYLEPGKAVWKGKEGTLTIRSGKGFQPVFLRKAQLAGRLLVFVNFAPQSKTKVVLRNLTFVDWTPANKPGSGSQHSPIFATCSLETHRCFFATNNGVIVVKGGSADTQFVVKDCYFQGLRTKDRWTNCQAFVLARGDLRFRNNLLVGVERAFHIGGGIDRKLPPQSTVNAQHNTLVYWGGTLFLYAKSTIESSNNLFVFQRGLGNGSHGFGLGSTVENFEVAQDRIRYRGIKNLYHQVKWDVWKGSKGFKGWQRLTKDGEQSPIFADPRFANPQLVLSAKNRILPPNAFTLRPDSPARRAGTDGKDIGCDLSKIPTPPPLLEKLIAQILQKK